MNTKTLSILALSLLLAGAARAQTSWYWTNKASLPQQYHPLAAAFFAIATLNSKFYTVGGGGGGAVSTLLEYDPETDTWTKKADMLSPRYGPAAASLNGKLYAIGGTTGGSGTGIIATVEEYDSATDTWTNRASMNQIRYAHNAVALNGKIYAIGGQTTGDAPLASVEEYDPISNTWTYRADMPTPRVSFGVAVVNGKIYVVGGRMNNTAIAPVYEYNVASNTWAIKADIPTTREAPGVVAINGKILAIAGAGPGGFVATVYEYDPTSDTWATKPDLPTARFPPYAVLLDSVPNTLYVFGGYGDWSMIALSDDCSSQMQIQSQPQPQEASPGETATFSVRATNGSLFSCQWFFSNSIIAGATSSQLTISNLAATNFGLYSVIISNSCNSVTSNPARLWLYADSDGDGLRDFEEAEIYHTNPNLWDSDGDGFSDYAEIYAGKNPLDTNSFPAAVLSAFTAFELEFITKTGKVYQVQTSLNLTNWTNFDSPIPGTGTIWTKTYSTRGQPKLFYRIEDVTP